MKPDKFMLTFNGRDIAVVEKEGEEWLVILVAMPKSGRVPIPFYYPSLGEATKAVATLF